MMTLMPWSCSSTASTSRASSRWRLGAILADCFSMRERSSRYSAIPAKASRPMRQSQNRTHSSMTAELMSPPRIVTNTMAPALSTSSRMVVAMPVSSPKLWSLK